MSAQHLLAALFSAGIAISVGATVLSLGMTFTVGELAAPLHRALLGYLHGGTERVGDPGHRVGHRRGIPVASRYVPGLVLATSGCGQRGIAEGCPAGPAGGSAAGGVGGSGAPAGQYRRRAAVGRAGRHWCVDQCLGHRQEPAFAGASGPPRPRTEPAPQLARSCGLRPSPALPVSSGRAGARPGCQVRSAARIRPCNSASGMRAASPGLSLMVPFPAASSGWPAEKPPSRLGDT